MLLTVGASGTTRGGAPSGRSGDRGTAGSGGRRLGWLLATAGLAGLAAAVAASPADARAAASQDWPPFVLVAGLLLIGLVASDEGLFAAAGHQLARAARGGGVLFIG